MTPEQDKRLHQIIRHISKHNQRMELDPDYRAKWLAAVNETDLNTDTWAKRD